jgi:hypothetical protein
VVPTSERSCSPWSGDGGNLCSDLGSVIELGRNWSWVWRGWGELGGKGGVSEGLGSAGTVREAVVRSPLLEGREVLWVFVWRLFSGRIWRWLWLRVWVDCLCVGF